MRTLPTEAVKLTVRAETMQHLLALGNTPHSVAGALAEMGVRGVPAMPCDCPVAMYLMRKLSPLGQFEPVIGSGEVSWARHASGIEDVPLPLPVAQFVAEFDSSQGSHYCTLLDSDWLSGFGAGEESAA